MAALAFYQNLGLACKIFTVFSLNGISEYEFVPKVKKKLKYEFVP